MSSFRKRGKGKGRKRNYYAKRSAAVAKKLGYGNNNDNNNNNNNKRNPSNYNETDFNFTSRQTRKQRLKENLLRKQRIDLEDEKFGFFKYKSGNSKLGWILNITETIESHIDNGSEQSAVDLYCIQRDNSTFKCTVVYYPYFYIYCDLKYQNSMQIFLRQKFDSIIHDIKLIQKVDLNQKNHLSGIQKQYLKLIFLNKNDMKSVSSEIRKKIEINREKKKTRDVYGMFDNNNSNYNNNMSGVGVNLMEEIIDIREYDVPFITRVCIDLNIRVGKWYDITSQTELNGICNVKINNSYDYRPDIKIFAFDIETEKKPLKFPNPEYDRIIMISYMIDNAGYLIVNREIVSEDIDDFEYTPKPEYVGIFTIFNEDNELGLLHRFYDHIREERPQCFVHYNGDFFDWPYIEKRSEILGLDMREEICIWPVKSVNSKNKGRSISGNGGGVYTGRFLVNIDCYSWVSRDSYLPQGSQNLKAVTREKLGYNPVELDPEDMLPFAYNKPQELATYSVSDAVATYYLFKKYIQAFIFSLCTIIPLNSGDVSRKGTGTLCEALLMVKAYQTNIISPNKSRGKSIKFYNGHLLDNETYIGGTVEAFESGVFRDDIKYDFKLDNNTINDLIQNVDKTMQFCIKTELQLDLNNDIDMKSYNEIKEDIVSRLEELKLKPTIFKSLPLIYHLDVSAMYPNIILTNRLQPVAVVNNEICASCDYNRPGSNCQRWLNWKWRGKYYPSTKGEYNQIRTQLEYESFNSESIGDLTWKQRKSLRNNDNYKFSFSELTNDQQNEIIKKRLKVYSQKVYKRQLDTKEEIKKSCICQKENGFYVDTVRSFRDRRYLYKGKKKEWFWKKKNAKNDIDREEAAKNELMFDSMQLAHKCILNSFYGYVMRRGSRWYNMDMAAITTHIGGNIIRDAYDVCKDIGRPLELDTDGIWTLLPSGFPEMYNIKLKNSNKTKKIEYPGSMLNIITHEKYTNYQYQSLDSNTNKYVSSPSGFCSIYFEVDGPYKCMILPASTDEGRKLKKRYCVFNHKNHIEELKGFELKRRGELEIIKVFQKEVFYTFLKGNQGDLQSIYKEVGDVGARWLNVLDTRARELSDDDLFLYLTESKNMSKSLKEYGKTKSTSITCAKRLAQFLNINLDDTAGLSCKYIISFKPTDAPVSERAIPVEIFKLSDKRIMKQYIKKWVKDSSMNDFDIRNILDWDYYRKRVGSNIQKIVTIPAAMQNISNPIPTLAHPKWLDKMQKFDIKQKKITNFFVKNKSKNKNNNNKRVTSSNNNNNSGLMDIEEFSQPTQYMSQQKKQHKKKNVVFFKKKSQTKNNNNNRRISMNDTLLQDSLLQDSILQDSILLDSEPQESFIDNSMLIDTQNENVNTSNITQLSDKQKAIVVDVEIDNDFDSWLKQSKQLWAQQQEKKKRYKKKKRKRGVLYDNDNNNNNGRNKRRRLGNDNNDGGVDGYFRIQQRLDELYNNSWEIIQIYPSLESSGKYILWIYVNNRLRRIKLFVHRPFYINVIKIENFPDLKSKGELVSRILPRSRPTLNLLKIKLPEDDFQQQSKQISIFLAHPDIEGVYETNVPLIFRIISNLGCCCAVSQLTNMKNTHSTLGFELNELEFQSTAQHSYLNNNKFNMLRSDDINKLHREDIKYMYFYHSTPNNSNTNNDMRSIFGFIYQLKREKFNEYHCRIIGVEPHKNVQLKTPQIQVFARKLINEFELNHHKDIKIKLKETKVKNINAGYAECNKFLDQYNLLLNGPTIILLQSTLNIKDIYTHIPIIADTFPLITFHFNQLDNKYPALQWYQTAAQQMITNWLVIPNQLEQKKGYSRYSHIPIGNMPEDVWSYTSDVFFSRLLADNKHLWWISNGCRPDLGGLEEDENLFDDEHYNPVINNPGSYHSFCWELNINHLATNTILQSDHIQSLEMGTGCDINAGDMIITDHAMLDELKLNYKKSTIRIDDTSSCINSFKILKKLVSNWFKDVANSSSNNNLHNWRHQYADRLLMEFYRWLRSSSSALYDPLLHRMVHRLMKKVFLQLIGQFKRFGAKIIYASFDKIILETGKNKIENAVGYIDSCLNSMKNNPLFEWLIVHPSNNLWECLIWYDHANYGGYLLTPKDLQTNNNDPNDKFKLTNFDREIEVRWNVASYLPSYVEDCFDVIFGAYLTDIRNEYHRLLGIDIDFDNEIDSLFKKQKKNKKKKKKIKKKKLKLKLKKSNQKHEMDATDDEDDDLFMDDEFESDIDDSDDSDVDMAVANNNNNNDDEKDKDQAKQKQIAPMLSSELMEKFKKYKQEMITNQISRKIFEYINQIKSRAPKDTTKQNEKADIFPDRPGSYLPLQDPALEFIKYLCLVLSLDKDIEDEVMILRKNLLRMVDVGGFSEISKFKNPCITYILPDVNCFKCKQSRDIDLCRDEFTKPISLQNNNINNNNNIDDDDMWNIKCHQCGTLYDRDLVESMLLDVVRRRETSYHVQDIICKICHKAKEDDLREYCPCSGEFKNKETKDEFEKSMKVFYNIAQHFEFDFLLDTVEWIIKDTF